MAAQLQSDLELDRYDTLISVGEDDFIEGNYLIIECDSNKDTRTIQVDMSSGRIIYEEYNKYS